MRLLFISLILLNCSDLFACDCRSRTLKEAQSESINNSPLIFVGDVLFSDQEKQTYDIEIVEVFKGEVKTKIIKGKLMDSCSRLPDKGLWIIYAKSFENGVIEFDICGLSRSFENPHNLVWATDYEIPPPPTTEYDKDSKYSIQANINFQKEMTTLRRKALDDLDIEIKGLRAKK
jgi:hypothetical protein